MALEFYAQDDTLLDPAQYLDYLALEPDTPQRLGSFDLEEYRLLGPWVEAGRRQGLTLGHYYDDTILHHADLQRALNLLEETYQQLTGRSVFGVDHEVPHSPYRKIAALLQEALRQNRGLLGICD